MELVEILKTLWSKRIWVALAGAIALLAALSMLYRPGLPPESRATTIGAASTEILVDAPESTLGDLRRDITPLVARGGIFSRFLVTEEAVKGIARESGIPARDITVAGPKLSIDGIPDQASAKRALRLGGSGKYLVQVQQGDDLPLLSIFTQGPSAARARALADGTAAALTKSVTDIQEQTGVRDARRLTIRQLGEARAGELSEGPSGILAVVAFFGVFALICLGILAWPRLVAAWKAPAEAKDAPWDQVDPDSWGAFGGEAGGLDLSLVPDDRPALDPEFDDEPAEARPSRR